MEKEKFPFIVSEVAESYSSRAMKTSLDVRLRITQIVIQSVHKYLECPLGVRYYSTLTLLFLYVYWQILDRSSVTLGKEDVLKLTYLFPEKDRSRVVHVRFQLSSGYLLFPSLGSLHPLEVHSDWTEARYSGKCV